MTAASRPLKSLADLPKDLVKEQFNSWDPGSLRKEILLACTPTLREWLTARCGELVYQKINRDRVDVLVRGAQVIVRVDKVQRFAFKIKISLGE